MVKRFFIVIVEHMRNAVKMLTSCRKKWKKEYLDTLHGVPLNYAYITSNIHITLAQNIVHRYEQ